MRSNKLNKEVRDFINSLSKETEDDFLDYIQIIKALPKEAEEQLLYIEYVKRIKAGWVPLQIQTNATTEAVS